MLLALSLVVTPSSRLSHLSIVSSFLHLPGLRLNLAPSSTWDTSIQSSSEDVSGVVFEPGLSFVHVSNLVSGVVFELGSELPFAIPVAQIELRGCF